MAISRRFTHAGIAFLWLASVGYAQEYHSGADEDMERAVLSVRGGILASAPRGTFPSVIVGNSQRPTGAIGQEHAQTAIGSTFSLSLLVPIIPHLGWTAAIGTDIMVSRFGGNSPAGSAEFTAQVLKAATGVEWSLLHFPESYRRPGLRSLYLAGGVDVGLSVVANRFEGAYYADTLAPRGEATGSFTSEEPFRFLVAVGAAVGLRFAATPEIEVLSEAGYTFAVNPLFSSDAIVDNDFAVDRMTVIVGVGWRF